ncbi:hypothetical protein [Brevibacterium aurantiacum]|uniref:hypothetical protein n=1 Tax=Brevibacterium aurantiacum TaxID=273384 RepID=UPI0015E1320D|nr:hypothetical protein [Brevibacterium aurantiacum]
MPLYVENTKFERGIGVNAGIGNAPTVAGEFITAALIRFATAFTCNVGISRLLRVRAMILQTALTDMVPTIIVFHIG